MKITKRNITVVLFGFALLLSLQSKAQLFKANVSAGFTISQIEGVEVYGFKHTGLVGGVGVMMPIIPEKTETGFQLSTEILFNQRGAKNTNLYDPFEYKCNLNYIDIPFMIHYADKRAGAIFGVGLQYGRLISSNESWKLPERKFVNVSRPSVTDNHDFKKNDLSFVADFRFNIWRNFKFDIRWHYSLLPIREDFEFNNSYYSDSEDYKTWLRDYKSHYLSFKLVYVINEEYDNYRTKPNRRRGAY